MARLPEAYEEKTIVGMLPGDVGYTVPWAMGADANRELWVNGDYTVSDMPSPGNTTVKMKIERTQTGVIVYLNTVGDYRFNLGDGWANARSRLPVELRQ